MAGRTIAWDSVQRVSVAGEIDPRAGYRVSSGVVLVDAVGGGVLRIESGQLAHVESAAVVAAAIEDGRAGFSHDA